MGLLVSLLWVALAPTLGLVNVEPETPDPSPIPHEAVAPLEQAEPGSLQPWEVAAPLDEQPPLELDARAEPDPMRAKIVRLDLLVGPVFRTRRADALLSVGAEYGRKKGFSGTFHTEFMISSENVVRALDVPIGLGAVYRGRLRGKGLYGSVGLTAGILVHRARIFEGIGPFAGFGESEVTHRVDPDFRLPLGFGWTAGAVGLSMAVVQGYSVRRRTYERRGAEVWTRSAYRIGVVIGLHFDIRAERREGTPLRSKAVTP